MLRAEDRIFPPRWTWATPQDYIWRFECLNGIKNTVPSPDGEVWEEEVEPRPAPKRRQEIFDASHGRCHYCAIELDVYSFHVEHKIPKARGGSNKRENLVASCASCNFKKRTQTEEEFKERLQREYVNAVKLLATLTPKLETAQAKLRIA